MYQETINFVTDSLNSLDSLALDSRAPNKHRPNEATYKHHKELLMRESRNFVSVLKLFVKSATEDEDTLLENLSRSFNSLQAIINHAYLVVESCSFPDQSKDIVCEIKRVAQSYAVTVKCALNANGRHLAA